MTNLVLARFRDACRTRRGAEINDVLRDATGAFNGLAHDPSVIRVAATWLSELEPPGAAWLALTLGSAAETVGTASVSGPLLLENFRVWLDALPKAVSSDPDDPLADPTEEQSARIAVLDEYCMSVVAHLGRMPAERLALAQDQSLLDRLEALQALCVGPMWVGEALKKTSGTLIALHVESQKGVRLKYENLSNCFHLFTLLQAAVGPRFPGGHTVDPTTVAVARGQKSAKVSDTASWHYGHPRVSPPALTASIWGEGSPRSIPIVDDVQVVLLWPTILSTRSWDAGFFGPHLEALPANVVVEAELSPKEAVAWMERLGLPLPKKKWWQRG